MLLQAEKRILEEISKNSRAAQMEIHALLGKVYSDELALDLNRQSAKYARLQEKAEGTLKKEGEKPKPQGLLERSRCWAAIQTDTVWNISMEHVAEILLRDEQKRLDAMMDLVREQKKQDRETEEIAEEFMDFQEENIRILRTYL